VTTEPSERTYHLVISLHPEDRSPDAKEFEHIAKHLVDVLGFSEHQYIAVRHSDQDHVPQRAADCEAHQGIGSFARWARENLRPAIAATELRERVPIADLRGPPCRRIPATRR
jgi:hypothetical protein